MSFLLRTYQNYVRTKKYKDPNKAHLFSGWGVPSCVLEVECPTPWSAPQALMPRARPAKRKARVQSRCGQGHGGQCGSAVRWGSASVCVAGQSSGAGLGPVLESSWIWLDFQEFSPGVHDCQVSWLWRVQEAAQATPAATPSTCPEMLLSLSVNAWPLTPLSGPGLCS